MNVVAISERAQSVNAGVSQGPQLRIMPILGPSHDEPSYRVLNRETVDLVRVTEVSDAGSVPELIVENTLDVMVFLMDGQELIGAKQNRILNTDVLVPARSTLRIPVSCVEQGRWRQQSASFSTGKSASHRTRSAKLARVHASLKSVGVHDADQGAVWDEVAMSLEASGASSSTSALSDAYAKREADLIGFRSSLKLPKKAVGVAVFHSGKFQGLDLFDRHSTLQYFWESLVDSYSIDLLDAPIDPAQPGCDEVEAVRAVLGRVVSGEWERFRPPGEGAEWRMDASDLAAASLVWDDKVVVHLQVFPKSAGDEGKPERARSRLRRNYGII